MVADYNILPLGADRCTDATEFVCEHFIPGSVLHQAMNITQADYTDYLSNSLTSMISEDSSFIATDKQSNNICGCLIAAEFSPSTSISEATPESARPISALLMELEAGYLQSRTDRTLLVDIAVVSGECSGKGIYTALRTAVQKHAIEQGYSRIIGELSAAATQHLCVNKLGHRVIREIPYSTFEYRGSFPFASITQPKSIQLVECVLAA